MDSFFSLQNLEIFRNGHSLFSPLTAEVLPGKLVFIRGPNGVGKSSVLSLLAQDKIEFTGKLVKNAGVTIFHLPQLQSPTFHIPMSLKEVSQLEKKTTYKDFQWFPQGLWDKSWNESSGGERMRALMARALNSGAKVLLLDEIFNHVEKSAINPMVGSCLDYIKSTDACIIIVSHVDPLENNTTIEHEFWELKPKIVKSV